MKVSVYLCVQCIHVQLRGRCAASLDFIVVLRFKVNGRSLLQSPSIFLISVHILLSLLIIPSISSPSHNCMYTVSAARCVSVCLHIVRVVGDHRAAKIKKCRSKGFTSTLNTIYHMWYSWYCDDIADTYRILNYCDKRIRVCVCVFCIGG